VDEFELIRRYFSRSSDSSEVVAGVGDDGAVLRPPAGRDLVTVIDTMVAGTHFPLDMNPRDVGYRIVAVNLSDIAAMGAEPRWMTLALTLVDAEPEWLDEFAGGLYEAAGEWGVALVGGDTTKGDQLVVSIQMSGDLAPGTALYRGGAKAGDTIYVTGTLGSTYPMDWWPTCPRSSRRAGWARRSICTTFRCRRNWSMRSVASRHCTMR
jgi:thiamine-monophosphate kinase